METPGDFAALLRATSREASALSSISELAEMYELSAYDAVYLELALRKASATFVDGVLDFLIGKRFEALAFRHPRAFSRML
jgi:hypothetical protein